MAAATAAASKSAAEICFFRSLVRISEAVLNSPWSLQAAGLNFLRVL
ncbi:MAG: hypothetical protein MZV70_28845 [Desulfobacterales bacterium]|nr:hypothetical protein [Desulfobacterales bacterium]